MDTPQNDVPLLDPRDLFRHPTFHDIQVNALLKRDASLLARSPDSTGSGSSSAQTSCSPGDDSGACQKTGGGAASSTVPIVIGVVIPAMIAAIILFVLHRRYRKMVRKEDAEDRYKSLDFGVDEKPTGMKKAKSRKGKPQPEMSIAELKSTLKKERGISMDLTMQHPYMLPPELQTSTESLHSLSRSFNDGGDKYRVTDFVPDDGSIRSPSRCDSASIYTKKNRKWETESKTDLLPKDLHHDNMDSFGHKTLPPQPNKNASLAPPTTETDRNSTVSNTSSTGGIAALRASNNYLSAFIHGGSKEVKEKSVEKESNHAVTTTTVTDLGTSPLSSEPTSPPSAIVKQELPPISLDQPASDKSQRSSVILPHIDHHIAHGFDLQLPEVTIEPELQLSEYRAEPSTSHLTVSRDSELPSRTSYYDYGEAYHSEPIESYPHEHPTLPNIQVQQHDYYDDDAASDYYDEEGYEDYQNYMGYNSRRSMMGTRPLPPDDPSENPEQRANRIRSFYKEYFDDLIKPGRQSAYDDGAMDDVYGYYEQTHPDYRPPSLRSERHRAYSHGSYMPGPRAYSSMSGRPGPRMRPVPKKKGPPPKPLMLLPTPHKLKDDDFLPNAIDYAPPQLFKNQRAGTPDSLRGGSRPYSPSVRAHIPLQSSFDDLAVMPSPHMLRKSGTFTNLDFAPPRRFKDNETMSDAGSIRSNRSGISALHAQNIRNGAYRVSRIPKEVAGTRNEMINALRPRMDIGR